MGQGGQAVSIEEMRRLDSLKTYKELQEAKERIKRLEEAGNEIIWWFCPKDTSHLSSMQSDALRRWNKAKQDKL
jgi:2-methylisocitrate lyase-like PEP mutase family enzyme